MSDQVVTCPRNLGDFIEAALKRVDAKRGERRLERQQRKAKARREKKVLLSSPEAGQASLFVAAAW